MARRQARDRSPLRVVVVSDVRLYASGLATQLRAIAGCDVIGEMLTAEEAFGSTHRLQPDVLVIDCGMRHALALARALIAPGEAGARVVAVGIEEAVQDVVMCAEAGVAGFVTRDATVEDLWRAIQHVAHGDALCSPRSAAILLRHVAAAGSTLPMRERVALTAREWQVAELLRHGLANKEISQRLHIKLATAKNHVHRVLEKLHVSSRAQAAAYLRGDGSTRLERGRLAEGAPFANARSANT